MRLVIAAVGRLKDGPERALTDRYLLRAGQVGRGIALTPLEVAEVAESRARRPEDRRREEAVALRGLIGGTAAVIALDERGRDLGSTALADRLRSSRDGGQGALAFVIGGPDGLDPEFARAADLTLAFGAQTWPHQMVRAMLAEQLYRAMTILAGHPYHRA